MNSNEATPVSINNRVSTHWTQDLRWLVAPFWNTRTLRLPIPPTAINTWLLRYIAGEWHIDGGRTSHSFWLAHEQHTYRGDVQGNTFTLTGPWQRRKIPMVIRGELQPAGEVSMLRLTIRPHASRLLMMLAIGLFWFGLFLLRAGNFFHFDAATAATFQWFLRLILLMWLGSTYLVLTMVVHQQYQLLVRRLTDCANTFAEQGNREQHRFP